MSDATHPPVEIGSLVVEGPFRIRPDDPEEFFYVGSTDGRDVVAVRREALAPLIAELQRRLAL